LQAVLNLLPMNGIEDQPAGLDEASPGAGRGSARSGLADQFELQSSQRVVAFCASSTLLWIESD
jgi:hypothetical protein